MDFNLAILDKGILSYFVLAFDDVLSAMDPSFSSPHASAGNR